MSSKTCAYSVYRHKVHYYETDQMGVVHHSNYIRWFEESRTDLLEQMGISYARMEELGIIIPVLAVSCEFKQSVKYGETVRIIPRTETFTGLRMSLSYRIVDDASGELRAFGSSGHCFLDGKFKPLALKRLHPEVYELFAGLVGRDMEA
jgi:acyl-CoA thioester hydrolase